MEQAAEYQKWKLKYCNFDAKPTFKACGRISTEECPRTIIWDTTEFNANISQLNKHHKNRLRRLSRQQDPP